MLLTCAVKWYISRIMKHINDLLNTFGGTRATARALGVPSSTVNNWKNKGIPAKVEVLDLIQKKLLKKGKKITLDGLLRLRHD